MGYIINLIIRVILFNNNVMGQGLVTPRLERSDPIDEEKDQRQHPIYGDLGERIEA